MFCKYCGKEIPGSAAICPDCGQKLNDSKVNSKREKSGISQKLGKLPTILVGVIVVAALLFLISLIWASVAYVR